MPQTGLALRSSGRAGEGILTGTRIRDRRILMGVRQTDLARSVEISPSYLNLIEHNRRRIGGKLLIDIAAALGVEAGALTHGAEADLLEHLSEAAGLRAASPGGASPELDRVEEFIGRFPGWSQLIADQQGQIARLQRQLDAMADRLSHDPALSDVLHDLLSKITAIRSTAAILAETGDLDRDWQERFIANLSADSRDLAARSASLVGYLDGSAGSEQALVSPQEELEAYLQATGFHVAVLEPGGAGLDAANEAAAAVLGSTGARVLAAAHFRTYARDAALIPPEPLRALVAERGLDPGAVAEAFDVDLERAMRRLASLPASADGPAAGLVTCDGAGALVLRKPTDGFVIPRFGAACVYWPLFRALAQPGRPVRERIVQPGAPDRPCIAYAVAAPILPSGFDPRQPVRATMLVVPDTRAGAAAQAEAPPLEIGSSCRTCPSENCPARREGSLLTEGT